MSLSSAEAELPGGAKGCSHAVGFEAMAADLGIQLDILLLTDASAALGIVRRGGLGNQKLHVDVTDLWLQEKVRRNLIKNRKDCRC